MNPMKCRYVCWSLILGGLLTLMMVGSVAAGDLPNPELTPGALNPTVQQDNIQATICVRGWTKTIRPPVWYTNRLKKTQLRQYRYADQNPRNYEEDHLIPLSLGGNPSDPKNLWPEPWNSEWNAGKKDKLEYALFRAVCREELPLHVAQDAFRQNWIEAYQRYRVVIKRYHSERFSD
jgi:hypothetical protein